MHMLAGMLLKKSLLILSCIRLLPAAELVVFDLDAGLEWRPQSFDFTLRDKQIDSPENNERSGSDQFDYGVGMRLRGLLGRPEPGASWGPLYGIELAPGWSTYRSGSNYTTIAMRALAGVAWQVNKNWHIQTLAQASGSYSSFAIAGNEVFDDITLTGWPIGFGLRLGCSYNISRSWRLNADVGWTSTEGDLNNEDFDMTLQEKGPSAFLGIAWRFGSTPRPLD